MEFKNKKTAEISSILEEIEEVDKMIKLHKKNTDGDFMISQYESKKRDLLKEISLLLLSMDIYSDKILPAFKKILYNIFSDRDSYPIPKDLEKNLKKMDEVLA